MEDGCIKMQRCRVDLLKRAAFVSVILFLISVGSASAVPVTGCGALSTPGETYVLQNDISSSGTCFTIVADNITLDGAGYSITGIGYGVYLYARSGVTVKNLNVSGFYYGIYLYSSNYNTLTNNTANSNNYNGIYLDSSSNNTLTGNTASNSRDGIQLWHSSSYNTLTNNTANSNRYGGIYLSYSSNNTLSGNTMSTNTKNFGVGGSSVSHYVQTIDISNTVDGKPVYYLVGASNQVIDSSTNAGYVGIVNGVNVTVKDLTLTKNDQGVLLVNTSNSSILNVNAPNNWAGIYLSYSSNYNTLTNNTANLNLYGIHLSSSSNNTLTGNTANSNSQYGIYLSYSSNNTLTGNTANSNSWYGIYLSYSSNNTLSGNTMSTNTKNFGVDGSSVSHYVQTIDISNTVDGKPVYYLVGASNQVIDSSTNAGYVGIVNGVNVTVKDLTLTKNDQGVLLVNTSNSSILNVNAPNNWAGIYLSYSSNNTIENNTASNDYFGIYLSYSSNYNTLTNNTANLNLYGIHLSSSSNNILTNNTANSNTAAMAGGFGIYLDSSSNDNTLVNNTASSNDYAGIYLESSTNNTITSNNALNNSRGIYLASSTNNTITSNNASNNWDGIILSSNDYYRIYLYSSSGNNTLINNTVTSNVDHGIKLNLSDSNTIAGNTVNSNKKGIRLFTSNYNTVTNNIVEYSNRSGIKLNATSTYNNLSYNIASNNNKNGIVLAVGSDYNTISNNAVNSNNKSGIRVKFASNYNNITDNTANSNTRYGIYLSSSSNNLVYNNLFNNTNNYYLSSSTNPWNTSKTPGTNVIGGSYIGGNFWANPSGTGFSEGCYDGDTDGICDSGYPLFSGNMDYLPLTIGGGGGSDATQIDSCTTISSSGMYVLTQDLSSSSTCITIESSDVLFDGAGYSLTGPGSSYGVYVYNSSITLTNVTVKNTIVTGWSDGIYYLDVENGSITNNNATNNHYGIWLQEFSGNTIVNNTANSNNYDGIYLLESNDNTIANNTANSNSDTGIYLSGSSNNTLTGNNMSANTYNFDIGGDVSNFVQTIDVTNTVDGKPVYYLVGISDVVIDSSNNPGYVGIVNGVNVTVRDLTLTKNGQGVLFANTTNSSVLNVNALNNSYGIHLSSSSSNTITNNTAEENGYYDVYVDASSDAHCNNVIENITVSGNWPLKYFNYSVSLQDEILSQLILCNADNSTINNVTIEGSATKKNNGFFVLRTDNSSFTNIDSSNNFYGIHLLDSDSNTIANNNATNNHYGTRLYSSSYNTLKDNNASNNYFGGIRLYGSSNNTITSNNANSNDYYGGIYLAWSSSNTVANNTALNNENGIRLWGSSNNTIYLNNFIDNGNNVYSSRSTNFWNTPEPITYTYNGSIFTNYLGNYWSDYSGSDAEGDGIGDSLYGIDSDSDDYPLMEGFENYEIGAVPPGDTTPHTITITSPQNTTYATVTIDLNVSADEPTDIWMYSLNSAANVTFTPNTTITGTEGSNTIEVYANDTKGNVNSKNVSFTVDTTTTPTPTITGIDPPQPIANPDRQWIAILGTGFVSDSTVTLRKGSYTYPTIPSNRTEFLSSTKIKVLVGLVNPGAWSAQVTNPEDKQSNIFDFTVVEEPPTVNNPPNLPTSLFQLKSDSMSEIPEGGMTDERTVEFKGDISDPDGDQVKLQIELRRLDEYEGNFDETKGGFKESELVGSGSVAVAYASELIDDDYHWRARAVDEKGNVSEWVEFGTPGNIDFTVFVDSDGDGLTDEKERKYGTNPNNPDSDEDGLNDKTEVDLALQFEPILALEKGEYFNATNITNFLNNSRLKRSVPVLVDPRIEGPPVSPKSLKTYSTPNYYLDLAFGPNSDADGLNDALKLWRDRMSDTDKGIIYSSVSRVSAKLPVTCFNIFKGYYQCRYETREYIAVQYWFFYIYNYHLKFPVHEGDWEHITVYLDPSSKLPAYVTYNGHGSPKATWWKYVNKEKDGSNPYVYVANGSHASYPKPGKTFLWLGSDRHSGKGTQLIAGTSNLEVVSIQTQPWIYFEGKWGGNPGISCNSPLKKGCSPDGLMSRESFKNPGSELLEASKKSILIKAFSPVLLHAVDQYGRHVGVNETGDIEVEIPEAEYSGPDAHPQEIAVYNDSLNMTFYTTGIDEGTFNLSIEIGGVLQRELYTFSDVPTTNSTIAYVYESRPNELKVDQDGDGVIDEVLSNPVPWFEISPEKPEAGAEVTFNASSSYVPDEQVNYTWDFGDNGSAIGKIVQHEYKEPGYYSIKLTISGSEVSYEKTLQIDPPTEEVIEEPNTPSSSGGGGGGGGAVTSFETSIKNVLAGETIELDISDKDIPYINGLSMTAKQDIYSSKLSITDLDKKPYYSMEEPDATVFRYFKVSYDKKNYVESAKFKVSVNKSWLEDNDIDPYKFSLYRYTTTWEELDTEILKEDGENIYFEVTTPGFSYFSLGGANGSGYRAIEKEVSAPVEEETETVEPSNVETPTSAPPVETLQPEQEPVKAPEPEEEKGGICGPTAIVLLAMLALAFRRIRKTRG